jgi:hypothetical protein
MVFNPKKTFLKASPRGYLRPWALFGWASPEEPDSFGGVASKAASPLFTKKPLFLLNHLVGALS